VKTITQGETALEYIEATLDDVAVANRLAAEVLGRSLDELPPQTRRLLMLLDEWVTKETERLKKERSNFLFSRRALRAALGWTDFQIRVHLGRLVELEYVLVHRGGRGQSFVYELLYEGQGQDGRPFLIGLVDEELLRRGSTTSTSRGDQAHFEGPLSPARAPIEPTPSPLGIVPAPAPEAAFLPLAAESTGNPLLGAISEAPSYSNEPRAAKEENGITPLPKPVRSGNGSRRYLLRRA
jgi:hypothetical protein